MSGIMEYGAFAAGLTLRVRVDLGRGDMRLEHDGVVRERPLPADAFADLKRILEPVRGADDEHVRDQFANGCEQVVLTTDAGTVRWVFETDGACGHPTMKALNRWAWRMRRDDGG